MRIRSLPFEGYYEDAPGKTAETLQILAPEGDLDTALLWWTILPHGQTVGDDESRRDYVFHYQLDRHLGDGLFALAIKAWDAAGRTHATEIAAALIVTVAAAEPGPSMAFQPFWFISERLHFKPIDNGSDYPGPSLGRLLLDAPDNLPHRRLFGAAVGSANAGGGKRG